MSAQVKSADITSTNVKLIQVSNSAVVTQKAGSPSLGVDNETITITPNANLSTGTEYKVTVANVHDLTSVIQAPNPWDGITSGEW